jgi:hypothetical protein
MIFSANDVAVAELQRRARLDNCVRIAAARHSDVPQFHTISRLLLSLRLILVSSTVSSLIACALGRRESVEFRS